MSNTYNEQYIHTIEESTRTRWELFLCPGVRDILTGYSHFIQWSALSLLSHSHKKKGKLSISRLLALKHINNLNINTSFPSMFFIFQLGQHNFNIFISFFHLGGMCWRYRSKQVFIMQ